jgi:hypothetical protein
MLGHVQLLISVTTVIIDKSLHVAHHPSSRCGNALASIFRVCDLLA